MSGKLGEAQRFSLLRLCRVESILLLVCLILGLMLRAWSVDFGLPGKYRPDEELMVIPALGCLEGTCNPHFSGYPDFFIYFSTFLLLLAKGFHSIRVLCGSAQGSYAPSLEDGWLICRYGSVILGTLTIAAAYDLGRKFHSSSCGLVAALILSVCFLHVLDSKFATTDIAMTFFEVLALSSMFNVVCFSRLRDYLWLGIWCGLASSAKYTAFLLAVPCFVTSILDLSIRRPFRVRALCFPPLALAVGLVAFAITSPFIVIDWRDTAHELSTHFRNVSVGWVPLPVKYGWRWIVEFGLPYAAGIPLQLTAIGGICYLALRSLQTRTINRGGIILLSFAAINGFVFARSSYLFLRYLIPLLPVLAVFAGALIVESRKNLRSPLLRVAIPSVLTLCIVIPSIVRTARLNYLLEQTDTREQAREWIQKNMRAGESLTVLNNATRFTLPTTLPDGVAYLPQPGNLLGPFGCGPGASPRFVLVATYLDSFWAAPPSDADQYILEKLGTLVADFNPFTSSSSTPVFDPADAFWVPVGNFEAVSRPGPHLKIYKMPC